MQEKSLVAIVADDLNQVVIRHGGKSPGPQALEREARHIVNKILSWTDAVVLGAPEK